MMTVEDSCLFDLCRTIVDAVYCSLGSELSADEAIRLARDLTSAIALAILEDLDEPMPEVAVAALGQFFQGKGIADAGDEWRWVN
jgi:hypothetical protein